MKSPGIRQKLFAAFLGVVALPLGLSAYLSVYYVRRERAGMEQDRRTRVDAAFRRIERQMQEASTPLFDEMLPIVRDLVPPSTTDVLTPEYLAGVAELAARLRRDEPIVEGVRVTLSSPGAAPIVLFDSLVTPSRWDVDKVTSGADGTAYIQEPEHLCLVRSSGPLERLAPNIATPRASLTLVVEVNQAALSVPVEIDAGWAFSLDRRTNTLAHPSEAAQRLLQAIPDLPALLTDIPSKQATFERTLHGRRFTGFVADKLELSEVEYHPFAILAISDEAAFWRPLQLRVAAIFGAFGLSFALALWLAYYLSGRFVGTLTALSEGAEAIARGDFRAFERRSSDEFGRLAESMNKMATELAARMHRDEVDGWRRLVRVLSHEINNTLGPVRSVAGTVRDQIAQRLGDGDAAEDLQLAFRLIIDRTDALAAFIANYAELAKLPAPDKQPTQLGSVVRSAVELLGDLAREREVKLLDQHDATLPDVPLDPTQIERVVINLVKNALEAAPAGSTVTVQTGRSIEGVELVVEDRGPGISADARRHLFVPYFTTKPGGSGLGLALVRQIVVGHGGTVTVEDNPEGGTRMRVVLPAKESPSARSG